MLDNSFDRGHFLSVTLRDVERNSWSQQSAGVQRIVGSTGFAGVQTAIGASGIQSGITRALGGESRVARVRHALDQSGHDAALLLNQKYRDIHIDAVSHDLTSACLDLGLLLGSRQVSFSGATFLGSVGASDMPRLLAAFWGLKSLAPALGSGFAVKLPDYDDAFKNAWGPRHPQGAMSDRLMESAAARSFTHGHVVAVTALLCGIVAYAKRGHGTPEQLLKQLEPEIQTSRRLGPAFAQWLQQRQREVLAHPLLNRRADGLPGSSEAAVIPLPARTASAPELASAPAPAVFNPLDTMDQDVQAASMVRAAANGTPFCAVCDQAAKAAA